MASDHDHYEAYYAQKLWALLPAVTTNERSAAKASSAAVDGIILA